MYNPLIRLLIGDFKVSPLSDFWWRNPLIHLLIGDFRVSSLSYFLWRFNLLAETPKLILHDFLNGGFWDERG